MALSRRLHDTVVAPTIARRFPGLAYAAGRLDGGSEVLGFETELSQDHGWGPKLTVFVLPDIDRDAVHAVLSAALPDAIDGYQTRFAQPTDRDPEAFADGIRVETVAGYFTGWLGVDATAPLTVGDWLALPAHRLRAVADGGVWHDGIGLETVRETLRWYPEPIWRGLLANQWRRLSEEEAFVGRCGDVGDDLGSRMIAARQVREAMRLAFLLERVYPPYSKWFGSAFARLPVAASLAAPLAKALRAGDWHAREAALGAAYTALAVLQNATGLTPPLDTELRWYHTRPYRVLGADRFADALAATTDVPELGAAWQWADDARIVESPERSRAAALSQMSVVYFRQQDPPVSGGG